MNEASDFSAAARRALDAGFRWLKLHFAHGDLGQSFFSTHSNQCDDAYGGSLENRCRFLLETLDAVREVWPENLPLTARFGVIEYDGRDEETLAESIELAKQVKSHGLDLLSVSMGFSTPTARIPWAPGFLAPIAERVRRESGLPVASDWGFDVPEIAQGAVANEQLDLVMIGRAPGESALALRGFPQAGCRASRIDAPGTLCALVAELRGWELISGPQAISF
jgi:2,4-dienoyl-CoA reductase-like NADH-dependent reductase (Old Yellow Enzyme family)